MRTPVTLALFGALSMSSCSSLLTEDSNSFLEDAGFLAKHADGQLLLSGTGGFVYSPKLQGRVMISALDLSEPTLGFINHEEILNPTVAAAFANYGGEERFWIGPEGSQFSFYFKPGDEMNRDIWRVPEDLNVGAFHATTSAQKMERRLKLSNMAGSEFELKVQRNIEVPTQLEIEKLVGPISAQTLWTSFRSVNTVWNDGSSAWQKKTGLPCIWTLGMFAPGANSLAILPFRTDSSDPDQGPAVRTEYFGELDSSRFRIEEGFALLRTDSKYVCKVGIMRNRAKNIMAAYNPDTRVLTLVQFTPVVADAPYVSERWVTDVDPYYGDVINSYNHGGPEQFFELESSSPALELAPGESYTHTSTTCHFRFADKEQLAQAVKTALDLDWAEVERAWF
ncbi:MAG: hypothetical protein HQ519_17160 [Planctomycetes bacterium]|nr:hypothetical protein [Planctomycetota bacterium]